MKLSDVQKALNTYLKNNGITLLMMQFSSILALVYPIYLLLNRFSFLNAITGIIGSISIILYFAYLAGLIFCFAKNDTLTISLVFAIRTLIEIVDLFIYVVGINSILSILVYALLTVTTLYYRKLSSEV